MKKLFSVICAALLSVSMFAAEANIYASKVCVATSGTTATVSYVLNAPATSLDLVLMGLDKTIVKSYPITDASALTKGKHLTSVSIEAAAGDAQIWGIKAVAAANETFQKVSDEDNNSALQYYLPQGLVINTNPVNKNFGNTYVAEPCPGASDGTTATTKSMTAGLYVLNAALEGENVGSAYQYGLTMSGARSSFARPTLDADGMLYVANYESAKIYKINPADVTTCTVFADAAKVTKPVALAMDVDGGLFVMDNPNTTDGGTLKKIYADKIVTVLQDATWGNSDMGLAADGRGGVWIAQHRYAIDAYAGLSHVNANGEIDYKVASGADEAILAMFDHDANFSYRGQVAVSKDGSMIAFGGNKVATVFAVTYDAVTGAPTLEKKFQTTAGGCGNNVDGLGFDAVDNLYVMSASKERLFVWALPRTVNEYISPATSNVIPGVIPVESVTINPATVDDMEEFDVITLSAAVLPVDATDKTVTWSSTDANIASVDENGKVTANAVGTASIIATAGEKADTVTINVIAKKWFYPNVYAYDIILTPSNEDGKYQVAYKLNAPATAVKFVLKNDTETQEFELTGLAFGANSATVDLKDVVAGEYQWGVYATADLVSDDDVMQVNTFTMNAFSASRGMTVNINPASPRFGQIIIVDAVGKTAEGTGFKVYDPMFQGNDVLYTGAWSAGAASPMRVTIGQDDDLIYISDWSDEQPNIHIYDPADLTKETLVFGGTTKGSGLFTNEAGDTIHGSMSSCYVMGKGADRVLYTFDEDLTASEGHPKGMFRYDIGELTEPWTAVPSAVVYDNADSYEQNGNSIILPDHFGGWFISQDRATDASDVPALIHINAQGAVDYNSSGLLGGRTRGTFALNHDHTLAVTAGDNCINVWKVTWDENNAPSLEKDYTIPTTFGSQTSSTCYNVCFDYANNVYAIGDGKPLCVWAGWVDENESTVMMGNITVEATSLYEMTTEQGKIEKVVENGVLYIIRDGEKFTAQGAKL